MRDLGHGSTRDWQPLGQRLPSVSFPKQQPSWPRVAGDSRFSAGQYIYPPASGGQRRASAGLEDSLGTGAPGSFLLATFTLHLLCCFFFSTIKQVCKHPQHFRCNLTLQQCEASFSTKHAVSGVSWGEGDGLKNGLYWSGVLTHNFQNILVPYAGWCLSCSGQARCPQSPFEAVN